MNISRPLPDHPELSVFEYPGYREYRVTRKKSTSSISIWIDNLVLPIIAAILWQVAPWRLAVGFSGVYILYLVQFRLLALQYESVILLPPHGIQLETHRGVSRHWSLNIKKTFIPAILLSDAIIHEALYGWNVLFYLAAVTVDTTRGSRLHVAYEDLLPSHPILLQVYEGIHEIMLPRSNHDSKNTRQLS